MLTPIRQRRGQAARHGGPSWRPARSRRSARTRRRSRPRDLERRGRRPTPRDPACRTSTSPGTSARGRHVSLERRHAGRARAAWSCSAGDVKDALDAALGDVADRRCSRRPRPGSPRPRPARAPTSESAAAPPSSNTGSEREMAARRSPAPTWVPASEAGCRRCWPAGARPRAVDSPCASRVCQPPQDFVGGKLVPGDRRRVRAMPVRRDRRRGVRGAARLPSGPARPGERDRRTPAGCRSRRWPAPARTPPSLETRSASRAASSGLPRTAATRSRARPGTAMEHGDDGRGHRQARGRRRCRRVRRGVLADGRGLGRGRPERRAAGSSDRSRR